MTVETRSITCDEFFEKVAPNTLTSKESYEVQLFRKIASSEDFRIHYRDLTYVIFNADIRAYFAGKSAPEIGAGKPLMAERLGAPLPKEDMIARKPKAAAKKPPIKKTAAKTTPKPL